MAEALICPACHVLLSQHWICRSCRCFGHAEVISRRDPALCHDCMEALERRGRRHCKKCDAIKPIVAFPLKRRVCRTCRNKDRVEHARSNRERHCEVNRLWRRKRRTDEEYVVRARAQNRAYYHRHRDQQRARARKYAAEHAEAISAANRAYHIKHRQRIVEYQRQRRKQARIARKLAILRQIQTGVSR